jgi:hypothetical protein
MGEDNIAWMMSRMEVSKPPGVSILTMNTEAPLLVAFSSERTK